MNYTFNLFIHIFLILSSQGQPSIEKESFFGWNPSEANREICDKDHQLRCHQGGIEENNLVFNSSPILSY